MTKKYAEMKILFLDESGDHSLTKIDPQYPIFVLAGIIMDFEYHDNVATKIMNNTKRKLFNRENIILHTAAISRNKDGFENLKNSDFRQMFYEEMNIMMSKINYSVVAVAIKKDEHIKQYGLSALDPYLLSLECIVERFVYDLKNNNEEGIIIAECRNSILDNELDLAFLNLKIQGTRFIKAVEIKRRIHSLTSKGKDENITGLQIADLAASPIGRYVLGKNLKPDFEIIKQKLRKSNKGIIVGYGLIVLPKKQKPGPATQFPA